MNSGLEIAPYDQQWAEAFQTIKLVISEALKNLVIDIEHVGSTSIQGLGAKPILDIDLVIANDQLLPEVISKLEELGYFHQESEELARHLAFRDYLRNNPEYIIEYEKIKRDLTRSVSDRQAYTRGKGKFINRMLEKATL